MKRMTGLKPTRDSIRVAALAGMLAMVVAACDFVGVPTGGSSDGGSSEDPPPIETVPFVRNAEGAAEFATNDPAYLGPDGFTVWRYGSEDQSFSSAQTVFEARVSKLSGEPAQGYGLIFGVQDAENFLFVMVDTTGFWIAGKAIDSEPTYFDSDNGNNGWKPAPDIQTGYNVNNHVRVEYEESNSFGVWINGGEAADGTFDDQEPYYTGGRLGFIVVLASNEDFPEEPVRTLYEEITPSDIGLAAGSVSPTGADVTATAGPVGEASFSLPPRRKGR